MSIFILNVREAHKSNGLTITPIRNMVNQDTNQLFFDNLEIPAENLLGVGRQRLQAHPRRTERGAYFDFAAECVGDGYWFIDRAVKYANERVVFDKSHRRESGHTVSDCRSVCPTSKRRI